MLSAKRRSCDLLRLQRVADADVVLDVVPHDERAADASAHLAIGEQRDAHPAQLARRAALAALVRRPSRRRTRARCSPAFRSSASDGRKSCSAWPEQIVRRDADPVGERLVGEAQAELAVEMEDRQADAVGDEAQPVLALARLELQPLQVIDVAVRREEAADVSLLIAVGVVVDAHPERLAARQRELPFVAGAFAAERGVDVRAVELVAFATDAPR